MNLISTSTATKAYPSSRLGGKDEEDEDLMKAEDMGRVVWEAIDRPAGCYQVQHFGWSDLDQ